ncbi:trypsin-like peptidase domain-containing protein [Sphingomonas sp. LB3N6]|uniref:trypsin-like peptidase domain-containing protein n=1 Tax=Sphingomonas fucosidasi TaxID=3096164 RepID=UPI002FCC2711
MDVTGKLAEPDLTPFHGQRLHIGSVLIPFDDVHPRTRLVDQDARGAVLFIESVTPAGAHVHGTAFLVAPGIALTAWHTISAWEEEGHFGEPDHAIFACGAIGAELRVWEVRSINGPVAGGDVAMLILAPRFELGEEVAVYHFALAAAFPGVGSHVTALGMRLEPAEAVLPLLHGDLQLPVISIATVVSTGAVEDRYPKGIPRIAAPCLAANVFSIGGMSGGPVFDETGHVVGIVSESIGNDDVDDYVTFVSLIWPATLFEFEGVWPQGLLPAGSTLRDAYVRDGWRVFATTAGELAFLEGGSPDFIGPPNFAQG